MRGKMGKVTFVEKTTRKLDPCENTTVRALRNALETVGHNLADKQCKVKRGNKQLLAVPGYIVKSDDELTFE